MRLIDADALTNDILNCFLKSDRAIDVIKHIQFAPTVDAVVLPCKVGDTVWIVGDKFPAEIEEIRITDDGVFFVYVEYDRGYELTEVWDNSEFQAADIGKTVFLTREEAEAALAKMDGDGNA